MKAQRKAQRKARQRKKRAHTKRRDVRATDKAFAMGLNGKSVKERQGAKTFPHMEWDGEKFVPQTPAPSPIIKVDATLMEAAHKKLGMDWKGTRKGAFLTREVKGLADTGCQTCTAGVEFLTQIQCPRSYLVPTHHRINGITTTGLGIVGSVLIRFQINDKVTRQMVHISENIHGLYLSESALVELGVIHREFPQQTADVCGCIACVGVAPVSACCRDDGASECMERTSTPERPEVIPFEPTSENLEKFERWLLECFASSAFNTCTHHPLQAMTGVPMKAVKRKDGVTHPRWYTPIPVAFHWKKQVKADLDRDVRLGIIERVPQGELSEYCSRMVIAPKSNGKPRRTIDFQQLNKATIREVHHTPSPINLVSQIPADMVKTVLDAWNGYHSLLLDPESKELTTFNTEWGRYRYLRGPQGFHGTGDAYTRRFDDITSGEERYLRCVDDGLLYDKSIEDAFWHTFDHIKLCADNGIVFNPEKFKFARDEVEFAGFEVTKDGYRPADHIIEGIRDFPTPKNNTDVKSWFGLVQQVAYTFSESSIMAPFRELQSKKKPFYWDETLEDAFQKSKEEIMRLSLEGVRSYDLQKPTCLATDWSKAGLGFSLMQRHCTCSGIPDPNCGKGHWKLVFAGSKVTNESQKRYSPTEGECLAAAHGLNRCRMFTLGCPNLILATDHNPLTGILNDRRLDSIENPRLLRLKEKTLGFDFKIMYIKGGSHAIKAADSLSRHAVWKGEALGDLDDVEVVAEAHAVHQASGIGSVSWSRVNEMAGMDDECVALVNLISDGFPATRDDLPENLRRFWSMRDDLYVIDNVPFKSKKMLIPRNLRRPVLEGLHIGHQGVSSMLANARSRLFWPGLDAEVKQLRENCRQCHEQAPSQSDEPPITPAPPETPFEQTVADLFHLEGHTFIAYADRFSGWLEVDKLRSGTFRDVRWSLLRWFRTYGVPEELATDGGPPFNSLEYRRFLRTWNVERRLSSAYYPRSNGRAEAAVKSAKRILLGNINPSTGELDTDAATKAIMAHRNTPTHDTGVSPSEMLFGRLLKDHLPIAKRPLRPEWKEIADARELALAKRAVKPPSDLDKRELRPLTTGDSVQIQNQTGTHPTKWFSTGVIAQVHPNRQYSVVMDGSRRVSLRNRKFLRKIVPISRRAPHFPDDEMLEGPGQEKLDGVGLVQEPVGPAQEPVPNPPSESVVDNLPSTRTDEQPLSLRRSTRTKMKAPQFVAKMDGKSHGYK